MKRTPILDMETSDYARTKIWVRERLVVLSPDAWVKELVLLFVRLDIR